jgi:NAD(P)-dependent dehydrogenase (short-subunit alcohol dehydrogenase family)
VSLDDRLGVRGKTAVVIGGGGGLGRACALEFARAGMGLVLADWNPDLLVECASMCRDAGIDVVAVEADGFRADDLTRVYAAADETFGRVDVAVNAIGLPMPESFADSDTAGWDQCIVANYTCVLRSMRLAVERMKSSGGSIINFTTIEAHRAGPSNAVYAGAKAGVTHVSRTLAVELAPLGIRINCLAPDLTPTERPRLVSFLAKPGTHQSAVGAKYIVPLGRLGTFDDIGGCALFLASSLSSYITGQTLHPDGGTFASSGWTNWPGDGGYGTSGFLPIPPQHVMDFLAAEPA